MSSKILLFTNSEHGQANVTLAVAYELAIRHVEVHIASFPSLETRLPYLNLQLQGSGRSVTFHAISGPSFKEALFKRVANEKELCHPPGVQGAIQSHRYVFHAIYPWTSEEYHSQLISIQHILEDLNPSGVVVECVMNGALDVCKKLGRKFVVLSPNSPKDYIGITQPGLRGLWKYPAVCSGYPFPVPITYIPANIYIIIRMIITIITSPLAKSINHIRASHGLTTSCTNQFSAETPYIFPALSKTEFPDLQFPANIHLCGPIILPSVPVKESDPALAKWLDNPGMKTVLVNLGSHVTLNAKHIRELGGGICILLASMNNIQVLWKIMADGEVQSALQEVVDPAKVKVMSWLDVEPYAILSHPNVVCSVHHGGANSFFEAVSAGVPQVILPKWYDTYDYARRVECLGIGLYGSPTSAPSANAEEFGGAMLRVLKDETFAENAMKLAQECGSSETGRVKAVEMILGLLA